MHTKILIVGSSGYLGSSLTLSLGDDDIVVNSIDRRQVDLSGPIPQSFNGFLEAGGYHYAVICSAITDVEKCFKQEELARQVNVDGTIQLLDALKENGVAPIFFSSDYVFRPTQSIYQENADRAPQTRYGRQKLAVEEYLEKYFERFLIFRTSKLMSKTAHSKNILLPVIQNLSAGLETKCFQDQWLNPVFIEDIGKIVKLSCLNDLNGVFHLGTRKVLNRYEIGTLLAESFGYSTDLIQPISLNDISFSEPRPTHNTLNCNKIERALDFRFTEIEDSIPQLKTLL